MKFNIALDPHELRARISQSKFAKITINMVIRCLENDPKGSIYSLLWALFLRNERLK